MTKHNFLPSPVLSFDIEGLKDSAERIAPSHAKLPRSMKKCVPIFAFFTMLFGSALLGFSVVIVKEGHVGFYTPSSTCGPTCNVQIYEPGTYFNLPWSKGIFKIIDVGPRSLTVGQINGKEANGTCIAHYTVSSVQEYIRAINLFDSSEDMLKSELVSDLKQLITTDMSDHFSYKMFGLTFNKIEFIL